MQRRSLLLIILVLLAGIVVGVRAFSGTPEPLHEHAGVQLRDGDIVFQQTGGEQGRAVRLATNSPWTHVGVLFQEKGRWMVYEAVGPVRSLPFEEWTAHGENGTWVAKRWVGADTTEATTLRDALKRAGERFRGLPYDLGFRWSDERIYCSELVWKMYAEGLGIHLCEPLPMKTYALASPTVQKVMRDRYGDTPPLDEPMVAPGALFNCPSLRTVTGS